jgi:hypothetical protein
MSTVVCSQITRASATFRASLPRQPFHVVPAQPSHLHPFSQQPPGFLLTVRAPFLACPGAAMARLLEHRRAHLEHPVRKPLAAPIPAPAQIAPPAILLRPGLSG